MRHITLPGTFLLCTLLGACATGATGGDQAAAPAAGAAAPAASAAAQPDAPAKTKDVHEASAQCWMKYDRSKESLEAKAKLVDKCIDEKMK